MPSRFEETIIVPRHDPNSPYPADFRARTILGSLVGDCEFSEISQKENETHVEFIFKGNRLIEKVSPPVETPKSKKTAKSSGSRVVSLMDVLKRK